MSKNNLDGIKKLNPEELKKSREKVLRAIEEAEKNETEEKSGKEVKNEISDSGNSNKRSRLLDGVFPKKRKKISDLQNKKEDKESEDNKDDLEKEENLMSKDNPVTKDGNKEDDLEDMVPSEKTDEDEPAEEDKEDSPDKLMDEPGKEKENFQEPESDKEDTRELEKLRAEMAELLQKNKNLSQDFDVRESELKKAEQEKRELYGKIEDLEKENSEKEKKLVEIKEEAEKYRSEAKNFPKLEKEFEKIKAELEESREKSKQYEEEAKEVSKLRKELEKTKADLEEAQGRKKARIKKQKEKAKKERQEKRALMFDRIAGLASADKLRYTVRIFGLTVLSVLAISSFLYLAFAFVILRTDWRCPTVEFLSKKVYVPAIVGDFMQVGYSDYLERKQYFYNKNQGGGDFRDDLVRSFVYDNVYKKFVQKYALAGEENQTEKVKKNFLMDPEINGYALSKVVTIKKALDDGQDFKQVADRLGDGENPDWNRGLLATYPELRNFEEGQTSRLLVSEQGYFFVRKQGNDFTYIFIDSINFDEYVDMISIQKKFYFLVR